MSWFGLALLAFCFTIPAYAGDSFGIETENYTWSEYGSDGSWFLTESGTRTAVSFSSSQYRGNSSTQMNMRFYIGDVFYDGQLQDGTPFQSTTGYTGFTLERKHQGVLDASLYGEYGAGVDFWQRVLDKGGVNGYTEKYLVLYVRAGLASGSIDSGWHGNVGFKYPLLVNEMVQVYPYDLVTLHPAPDISFYSEVGYGYRTWGWALFYDAYRFEQSPPALATIGGTPYGYFVQPKSVMDRWGVRFYTHY